MSSYWRMVARPIIAGIITAMPEASEKELRKAISAAYPFGARRWWPYKQWLKEVRWQLDRRFQQPIPWDQTPLFQPRPEP